MLLEKLGLNLPPFLAIDPINSNSEDAFRIFDTGDLQQLQVIAVVPDNLHLNPENYPAAIQNISDCINFKKSEKNLFSKKNKIKTSLSTEIPKPVISITFILSKKYITNDIKIPIAKTPTVNSLSVTVNKTDYVSYRKNNLKEMISICKFIITYLQMTDKKHLISRSSKTPVTNNEWMIRALLDLFNHACRVECRNKNIPYYDINTMSKQISVNGGYAVFNKPLRSFLSYVNSLNLYSSLNEQKIPFPKEPMVEFLSQHFKVKIVR